MAMAGNFVDTAGRQLVERERGRERRWNVFRVIISVIMRVCLPATFTLPRNNSISTLAESSVRFVHLTRM